MPFFGIKIVFVSKFMVLGVKMAEIFEKNPRKPHLKTRKRPLESVEIKISKIGLRHVLSWPKVGLEAKFNDHGTFGYKIHVL